MSLFDWLNRWLAGRLPSHRLATTLIGISASGLQVEQAGRPRLIGWQTIDRVVACRAGQLIGDTTVLVVGLRDGGTLTLCENDPGWRQLTEQLHPYLPGAKRFATWSLELLVGNGDVEVYRR